MTAGVEREEQPAKPTRPLLSPETFVPDDTISALRSHPHFQDAVRRVLDGANELYSGNKLLKRVMNDRGRFIGGMISLYLHFCSVSEADEPGFTVRRFQAFCVEQKLCSFGRARALLTLMCFSGYLTPTPSLADRRQRRLIPTKHLIELQRRRWRYQFEAMALVLPQGNRTLKVYDQPEFIIAFLRHLGAKYAAGFRLLHYSPDLSRLVENNAGLLLIVNLFLLTADGMGPNGTAVPISVSALSTRFGVARAHVRKLLADAAAVGLVRRTDESTPVIVLPQLIDAVSTFLAALFAILAHCASAAAEEIASGSDGSVRARASTPGQRDLAWV